jgi:hypothetical protein
MNKFILFTLLSLAALSISVQAQTPNYRSSRLDELSNQLKRQTVDLADRAANDLRRGYNNSRADLEAAFLAQQLDASAGFFQQMTRDNRSASELRDAASILSDLTRRAPGYGANGNLWHSAQNTISDISRELGAYNSGGSTGGDGGGDYETPVAGRAFWRGTVDNEVQLFIRDNTIETRTISGTLYADGTFSFTSSLPKRKKTIEVIKKKGRGNVRVLQQPSRDNDFTAVVQIQDRDGGAKEYQLEIFWR